MPLWGPSESEVKAVKEAAEAKQQALNAQQNATTAWQESQNAKTEASNLRTQVTQLSIQLGTANSEKNNALAQLTQVNQQLSNINAQLDDSNSRLEGEQRAKRNLEVQMEKLTALINQEKLLASKELQIKEQELLAVKNENATLIQLLEKEKQRAIADIQNARENSNTLLESEKNIALRETEAARRELQALKEKYENDLKAQKEMLKREEENLKREKETYETRILEVKERMVHDEQELKQQLAFQKQLQEEAMQTHVTLFDQFRQSMEKFQMFSQAKPEGPVQNRVRAEEMVENARKKIGLDTEDFYNFAVVGHVKAGKSNFINSIRGLSRTDNGAAEVDNVECTKLVTMYTFPKGQFPYIRIYDTPGCGTLSFKDQIHYEDMGLCAFDCLVILVQETLALDEINLALKAKEFHQPVAFVRSKCDVDIRNTKDDPDDEDLNTQKEANDLIRHLKGKFIKEIASKAETQVLRDVPIYCISSRVLLKLVKKTSKPKYVFEEKKLLDFIRHKALHSRNDVPNYDSEHEDDFDVPESLDGFEVN